MSLRIVVAGLMLTTALALGLIGYQLSMSGRTVVAGTLPNLPPPPLQLHYLIAARSLQVGMFLRDDDLGSAIAPPRGLPAHAIEDTAENRASLRGALVRRYLDGGSIIARADLLRPRDHGFLAAVLAPGTQAVSIPVDAVTGVSGLIWPGDGVDVILTQQLDPTIAPLARQILSRVILHNVRVIAVDQDIVRPLPTNSDTANRVPPRTVTLQVSSDQDEQLAIAQQLGHLSLAVRAIDAASPAAAAAQTAADSKTLFSGDVSPALVRKAAPVGMKMQVIEGEKRSEVTFQ